MVTRAASAFKSCVAIVWRLCRARNKRHQIAKHITDDPHLRTKRDLLRSIPGIGETTIAAILAELTGSQPGSPSLQRWEEWPKLAAAGQ